MTPHAPARPSLTSEARAAENAGEWGRAAELHGRRFDEAVAAEDPPGMTGAADGAARACLNAGRIEEAEELADLSREIAQRLGLGRETAQALNLLATIVHHRGDFVAAGHLYGRALEKARDLGDDALVAKTCLNLGVIAHTLGNLREGRARYLESVSAGIRSGSPEHAMRAYNNLGMVCTDLEEWLEAELHLDRGIEIAERLDDVTMQAILRTNRTEPLIHLGELSRARNEAEAARGLAERTGNASALSDLDRFHAMMAMREGQLDAADAALASALERCERHALQLCRAEVLEQVALLRDRQGRRTDAVKTLERAFDDFFGVGAKRDVSRVAARLEEWRAGMRERIRIGTDPH